MLLDPVTTAIAVIGVFFCLVTVVMLLLVHGMHMHSHRANHETIRHLVDQLQPYAPPVYMQQPGVYGNGYDYQQPQRYPPDMGTAPSRRA